MPIAEAIEGPNRAAVRRARLAHHCDMAKELFRLSQEQLDCGEVFSYQSPKCATRAVNRIVPFAWRS